MRLAVIGLSHVGVVSGAGFAEYGNDVMCVGLDAKKVANLQAGKLHIDEPGLDAMIEQNVAAGRIQFTTDLEAAVKHAEVVFLTLTIHPVKNGSPNLTTLFNVADRIGKTLDGHKVIATRSTVPVGTTDRLAVRIGACAGPDARFGVASNPAFLKEGYAVNDFTHPDRVVIGTNDERSAEVLRRLYMPFVATGDSILHVDARSAELSKYATSALLASRVSFMNELAVLADELGADIEHIRHIMGSDPRIGPKYLFVGPGFGGTNFSNDLQMLLASAREAGKSMAVVSATDEVNRRQKEVLVAKLRQAFGGLEKRVVAIWGLAYKPRTKDIGHAPAIAVIDQLLSEGAHVRVHDPRAMDAAREIYGDRVHYGDDMYAAAEGADALVLVTEWSQYRGPDFARMAAVMAGKIVVDGRNIWDPLQLREHGLRYIGLGRS